MPMIQLTSVLVFRYTKHCCYCMCRRKAWKWFVLSAFAEQEGDSEDAEGFGGSDDSQTDRPTPFSLDTGDISTYGEDCLVPEPHKV